MPRKQKIAPLDEGVDSEKLSASQLLLRKEISDIGIYLSRSYEFERYDVSGVHDLALWADSVADVSFLKSTLIVPEGERVPLNLGARAEITLPPGITIIMGRSGAGKTKLAMERMLGLNDGVFYARFGEPLDHRMAVILAGDTPVSERVSLLQFEVDLASTIAEFLFDSQYSVLVIDSLRYLFYASTGSTGKGGVNMTLFTAISFLDVVVSQRGKSLVVIVNPLTDDDTSYKAIVEAAKGSVSALIDVTNPNSLRFTSRYEDREWRSVQLSELSSPATSENEQAIRSSSVTKLSLRSYAK